jgi:hypothetical protein
MVRGKKGEKGKLTGHSRAASKWVSSRREERKEIDQTFLGQLLKAFRPKEKKIVTWLPRKPSQRGHVSLLFLHWQKFAKK